MLHILLLTVQDRVFFMTFRYVHLSEYKNTVSYSHMVTLIEILELMQVLMKAHRMVWFL